MLANGRVVMAVSGLERNIEADMRPARQVRVSLFDRAGHRVASRQIAPTGGVIAPGEARPFKVEFPNPPIATAEFAVEFAAPLPTSAAARLRPRPTERRASPGAASLRATGTSPDPVIRDARPLPASSPYALPSHG